MNINSEIEENDSLPQISTSNSRYNSDNKIYDANFETAIEHTGYGLFNIILLIVSLSCCAASIFETSTVSFILPSAECDLSLTLLNKGSLNAITYAGMISSAFFWGYLADTLGRKKLLVYGYFLDGLFVICSAFSQTLWMLMTFKFLGGFIICGPFAVLVSYISELHGLHHRNRILISFGIFFSLSNILVPFIAWSVLPQTWSLNIFNAFELHTWQIYLLFCSLPSIISGFLVSFLPESPKFLMSRGKNDEALKIFLFVYRINTGKSNETYKVKSLMNETIVTISKSIEDDKNDSPIATSLRNGIAQIKPMFKKLYLASCLLVFTIQFFLLMGLNTLRLWLPQLFQMLYDLEIVVNNTIIESSFCNMIETKVNETTTADNIINTFCSTVINESIYINAMIVGLVSLCAYFIASALINILGSKNILILMLVICGISGSSLYWAYNPTIILILSSMYVSTGSISSTALINVVVNLFPTSFRTMTVSLVMMFGRVGALLGNILFPFVITSGCWPPCLMIGGVILVCALICTFLPKMNKTSLK